MAEKQVTVKSMMLDFAAKLRKDGLDSVSLEFFERLANKEVGALEAKLSKMEEKLLSVLEVAVARGEKLGYEDAAYRKDLEEA